MQGQSTGRQPAASSASPLAAESGRRGGGALLAVATLAPAHHQPQAGGTATPGAAQGASDSEPELATPQPAAAAGRRVLMREGTSTEGLPGLGDASCRPDVAIRLSFGGDVVNRMRLGPAAQHGDGQPPQLLLEEACAPGEARAGAQPGSESLAPAALPATPQMGPAAAWPRLTLTARPGSPGAEPGSPPAPRKRPRGRPRRSGALGVAAGLAAHDPQAAPAPAPAAAKPGTCDAQDLPRGARCQASGRPGSAQQPRRSRKRPAPEDGEPAPHQAGAGDPHAQHVSAPVGVRSDAAQDRQDKITAARLQMQKLRAEWLRQEEARGVDERCELGSGVAEAAPAAGPSQTWERQGIAALGAQHAQEEPAQCGLYTLSWEDEEPEGWGASSAGESDALAAAEEERARAAQAAADRRRKGKQPAGRQPSSSDDDADLLALDLSGGGIRSKFRPEGKPDAREAPFPAGKYLVQSI